MAALQSLREHNIPSCENLSDKKGFRNLYPLTSPFVFNSTIILLIINLINPSSIQLFVIIKPIDQE